MIKKILTFSTSMAIFSSIGLGYVYYKTSKNYEENQRMLESGNLQDASRLTNQSFGINWGFQADDTIMQRLDSGDLLFMKFDCRQCISVPQWLRCQRYTMFMLDEEIQSIGIAFRDASGLYIYLNHYGETKLLKYSEIVSMPELKELSIQKLQKKRSIHTELKKYLEQNPDTINENPLSFGNRMNDILKFVNQPAIYTLRDFMVSTRLINVRTETNRSLRSL